MEQDPSSWEIEGGQRVSAKDRTMSSMTGMRSERHEMTNVSPHLRPPRTYNTTPPFGSKPNVTEVDSGRFTLLANSRSAPLTLTAGLMCAVGGRTAALLAYREIRSFVYEVQAQGLVGEICCSGGVTRLVGQHLAAARWCALAPISRGSARGGAAVERSVQR